MATGASQFLSLAGRVKLFHDGMIVTESVAAEDVFSVCFVGVTILAYLAYLLGQKTGSIGCMRIVTGQTTTACRRGVNVGLCIIRLVMALEAKFGHRGGKRQLALVLGMRGRVAGRASLVRARILAERGVDDPFSHDLLVAVEAGLLRLGFAGEETEAYAAAEKEGDTRVVEEHAAL